MIYNLCLARKQRENDSNSKKIEKKTKRKRKEGPKMVGGRWETKKKKRMDRTFPSIS